MGLTGDDRRLYPKQALAKAGNLPYFKPKAKALGYYKLILTTYLLHCQLNKFTIHHGIPDGETPSGRAAIGGCLTHQNLQKI